MKQKLPKSTMPLTHVNHILPPHLSHDWVFRARVGSSSFVLSSCSVYILVAGILLPRYYYDYYKLIDTTMTLPVELCLQLFHLCDLESCLALSETSRSIVL